MTESQCQSAGKERTAQEEATQRVSLSERHIGTSGPLAQGQEGRKHPELRLPPRGRPRIV